MAWNITMPEIFGLKLITYWQALRLLLIAAILFGGAGVIFLRSPCRPFYGENLKSKFCLLKYFPAALENFYYTIFYKF